MGDSERDREQICLWLRETQDSEDVESVLGIEDPDEVESNPPDIETVDTNIVESEEENEPMDVDNIQENETPGRLPAEHFPETIAEEVCGPPFDLREFYIGKDKTTRWYLEPHMANTSRTPRYNIIPTFHRPGPKGLAKNAKSHLESFQCIMNDLIIEKIVSYTNIYINKIKGQFSRERDARLTDVCEIKSLIGILLLAGTLKAGRKNVIEMWDNSNGTGVEAIYVTMSEHRFRFLMQCLRFDDVRSRDERRALDKLAPIREIFEMFLKNSQNSFNPSDYLTVDEQLVAFRGNCTFRQYIPSKAAKYGIKIFALVSASNFYTTNMEIYAGTQPEGPFKLSNASKDLVLRLVEPVSGSNRNITADNWFVSLPLAVSLIDEKSLTLVGTVRGDRRIVPGNFLADQDRETYSSIFGYHEKCTLVSYAAKPNKVVIALSTMHSTGEIDPSTGDQRKPSIITTYNDTKVGVDILDKMCKHYDCARNSRRWPLTVFFHLLNVGAMNSLNIFRSNNNSAFINRCDYLRTLALELMKPEIHRRINIPTLPKELRRRGRCLLKLEEEQRPVVQPRGNSTIGRCVFCGRSRDKKTRRHCAKCDQWACADHLRDVCVRCYE